LAPDFILIESVIPAYDRKKYGRIINFSNSGETAGIIRPHYAPLNWAVGLTHVYAAMLAQYKT
jgi:hypothetical protein